MELRAQAEWKALTLGGLVREEDLTQRAWLGTVGVLRLAAEVRRLRALTAAGGAAEPGNPEA